MKRSMDPDTGITKSNPPSPKRSKADRPVRVWADGCFDMMHYGHANALRQAKEQGDVLVVGVHTDEEIARSKGPTVLKNDERLAMVESCKWVDEVVMGAPYAPTLQILIDNNIDFVVHGEDVALDANGNDAYAEIKEAGKYRQINRTQGVSTTDLVGRLLLMGRANVTSSKKTPMESTVPREVSAMAQGAQPRRSPYTGVSHFLPTSRKIVQFSDGKEPAPGARIVYADGTFDLFHPGHVAFLKAAKAEGDFLIVGVCDDATVQAHKGPNHPVMNLHERVLSVLACKYADEVIIGAPWKVTKEMIEELNIATMVTGSVKSEPYEEDPYAVPREMGILKEIDSPSTMTSTTIVERIMENRKIYEERNKKKEAKELANIAKLEAKEAEAAKDS